MAMRHKYGLIMNFLKKTLSLLPQSIQTGLKRAQCRTLIAIGKFETWEPEFVSLANFVMPGDLVIDIGANIGHYTLRLSDLVGPEGRVIAFEPIPDTFAQLTANAAQAKNQNITLINVAASEAFALLRMDVPRLDTGLPNFYEAQISDRGAISILSFALDNLGIDRPVSLIKIDVEGHEVETINGAWDLISRHMPRLIVEHPAQEVRDRLADIGYCEARDRNSPNTVFSR